MPETKNPPKQNNVSKMPATPPVGKTLPEKKITVEDSHLIGSLQYMKQHHLLKENRASVKFETVKEVEDYTKEEITDAIKEQVNPLKEEISELQKNGYELHLESISLLQIPLKINVWMATCSAKDLAGIYDIINKIKPTVAALKGELEEKIKEKERLEKIKEDQEAAKQKKQDS